MINLFEIPIFIDEIDLKKIKLIKRPLEKTWISKTKSSYTSNVDENVENVIEKDSLIYLLQKIVKLLEEKVQHKFEISLINIWENIYSDNDYQEPHIHTKTDFSFIIYKRVEEDGGKTLFFNPSRNFIDPFSNISHLFDKTYKPKCKEGQMILFPSFLEHMVLKTSNQHTISGNIRFNKNEI